MRPLVHFASWDSSPRGYMTVTCTDLIVADQSRSAQGRGHFINAVWSSVLVVRHVFGAPQQSKQIVVIIGPVLDPVRGLQGFPLLT
jgi:hypothetical protein